MSAKRFGANTSYSLEMSPQAQQIMSNTFQMPTYPSAGFPNKIMKQLVTRPAPDTRLTETYLSGDPSLPKDLSRSTETSRNSRGQTSKGHHHKHSSSNKNESITDDFSETESDKVIPAKMARTSSSGKKSPPNLDEINERLFLLRKQNSLPKKEWESLIEITESSETSKLQEMVDNIEHKLTDPNECPVCHRVLSCRSALRQHYRTHTGDRPFRCRICGRAFTTKGNLKTHIGVHKLKPFMKTQHKCPICHKRYSNAMVLQQHINMHTGDPSDLTLDQIRASEVRDFRLLTPSEASSLSANDFPPESETSSVDYNDIPNENDEADRSDNEEPPNENIPSPHNFRREEERRFNGNGQPHEKTLRSETFRKNNSSEVRSASPPELPMFPKFPSAFQRSMASNLMGTAASLNAIAQSVLPPPHGPFNPLAFHGGSFGHPSNAIIDSGGYYNDMHPGIRGNTTCNICFKTFACHSALEIHYRSHTKERPYKCNICHRGFSTKVSYLAINF